MTESRGSYTPSSGDPTQYDENGFDPWGYTAAEKQSMLARFATRLADQPGTMAALLAEFRRSEGMSEERLRQHLEITPEQYSRLSLCLVPRNDQFADDVRQIAEISGAKASLLANLVHQVSFLAAMPARTINANDAAQKAGIGGSIRVQNRGFMAARDRTKRPGSVHEAGEQYEASAPAPASDSDVAIQPEENSVASDIPPVDPSHDE